jgi:hypothetical protein
MVVQGDDERDIDAFSEAPWVGHVLALRVESPDIGRSGHRRDAGNSWLRAD